MKTKAEAALLAVLVAACLTCGCGVVTLDLIDSCMRFDPHVAQYNAVYWKGNRIAVDYSVKDAVGSAEQKRAESYWAELECAKFFSAYESNKAITIHRKPLPGRIRKKWEAIPIQKFSDIKPQPLESAGYRAKPQPPPRAPEAYMDRDELMLRDIKLDPTGTTPRLKSFLPLGHFMPPEQIPRLIVLFPIALIGDIVMFPCVIVLKDFPHQP